jgi:hypothetical protein
VLVQQPLRIVRARSDTRLDKPPLRARECAHHVDRAILLELRRGLHGRDVLADAPEVDGPAGRRSGIVLALADAQIEQ